MRRRTYFFISFFVGFLCAPFCVFGDSNNIVSLSFTTNPQTIAALAASQAITVETQNSSGTAEKVSETNDVTFTSSSPTGQFLNSSGSAVSTTMSTNTASRTFYYEDATAGTYTLTVAIKGRTSGKQFSASQTVVVTASGSASPVSPNATSTDTSSPNTNANSSNESNEESSQSYASQAYAYQGPDNEPFNVTIGRNRLVVVGEPVAFNVRLIPESASFSGINFHWAFGDGTEWTGSAASHTYEYPGDYVVVVDADRYGDEAVAEAKVRVVDADVSVSRTDGGSLVIANNANEEINLGGFSLVDDLGRFLLPQDTIVSARSSTTIPAAVMKTRQFTGSVALYNPEQVKLSAADIRKAVASGDIAMAAPAKAVSDDAVQKPVAVHAQTGDGAGPASSETSGGRPLKKPALSLSSAPATSSVAAVVYAIPRPQESSAVSGIVSWIKGLFGSK